MNKNCKECDKKHIHNDSCGFTPAVIEIHNPTEISLFKKVIIPASLGDEKQTPVTIGKYCNVLMVYEANGHAYLYSSDGIPTKIAFDSGGVLFVEELPEVTQATVGFLYITAAGLAAITNDNESWVNISGGGGAIYTAGEGIIITNNVISVDDTIATKDDLTTAVEAEAQAREQADASLASEITSLSSSLSDETTARTAADTALQTALNTEQDERRTTDLALQAAVNAEEAERQAADTALQTVINDEKTAREAADTRLQGEITDAIQTLDDEIAADMAILDGKITAEATARAEADATKVDKVAGKGLSTNDFTNADKDTLSTALQPDDINYTVMTDLKMKPTASTTSVVMEGDKVNLKEGTPSDFEIPLPVASATQAGVINTATYQSIQNNTAKINAIEGGSVAVTGISASPSQADLTSAWQTATGQTTLINGASILDVDNDLRWTYYTNTSTWYSASTGGAVSVSPFTNTEAGIIKGSNVDGQVHAETDGTGSVQGWDTVKADIATNTSAIAAKVDKETGKGLSTNDFTTAYKDKLDGIAAGAEVNSPLYSTTGSNTDGAMTQAATTNALNDKVDKVTGKQLSTNDFTNADKSKLDSIEAGAQVNSPLYATTGQNTDGAMTQKATTDELNTLDKFHVATAPRTSDIKIENGSNLNAADFMGIGTYYVQDNLSATTLTNCPTRFAFTMNVYSPWIYSNTSQGATEWYRFREILDVNGDVFTQLVRNRISGEVVYNEWKRQAGVFMAHNSAPATDTPTAWAAFLKPTGDAREVVYIYYNTAGQFDKQPATYGVLETITIGEAVYQTFYSAVGSKVFHRFGNANGWNGVAANPGDFYEFLDTRSLDDTLSTSSTNPVKNFVITGALLNKLEAANILTSTGLEKTISGNDVTVEVDDTVALIETPGTSTTPTANVGTAQLADSAVTAPKLAEDAVTTVKIQDGAVTSDKVDFTTFGAITLTGSGTYTNTPSGVVPLGGSATVVGNKLSKAGNTVVVGAGVSAVEVSASAFCAYSVSYGNSYGWFSVCKNGERMAGSTEFYGSTNDSYGTVTVVPRIIEVQEGDVIDLRAVENVRMNGGATYLTVKMVA